jgi:hypothetical protein
MRDIFKMRTKQPTRIQKSLGEKNQAQGSGKLTCVSCHTVMSRRSLKKLMKPAGPR